MSVFIGEDILSIGSAKWNQRLNSSIETVPNSFAPNHFMLPAVENVILIVI